jgi:proline iminopeptidase
VFPDIAPYDTGMLDVGDGNLVYWEACGNAEGKPALVLHGGPGSGSTPVHRRWFDPAKYRIVLFDQRNAGRSRPHASDPETELTANTTQHLVADIERLRVHLGIERWLVWGNSWGSTLALVYAETFPERVSEVVLLAVTNMSRRSIDWLYHGVGQFFPEAWERFRDGVPEDLRDGDLVAAYYQLMQDPSLAVREQAARRWCEWEDTVVKLSPDDPPNPRYDDRRFRMAFTRIVTHYFHHGGWLEDGVLLRDADRLAGIPVGARSRLAGRRARRLRARGTLRRRDDRGRVASYRSLRRSLTNTLTPRNVWSRIGKRHLYRGRQADRGSG